MRPDSANSASLPAPESAASDTAAPVQIAQTAPPTPAAPAMPAIPTPAQAADNDRIEQEWVIKTKQILSVTRNDPFEQAQQLAALKADYMRKRYNKDIKLGD